MIGCDSLMGWVANGEANAFTSYITSRAGDATGLNSNARWGAYKYNASEVNGMLTFFFVSS